MSIRTKIITAILSLSLVAVMVPSGVVQAALTEAQIQSILSLLTSFGADATTVANVEASLRGTTPVTPPAPTGIPAGFQFTQWLSQGDVDQEVVYLKIVLASEGCISGVSNTTYFGSITKTAVQCFQQKYGTGSQGTTGPNTRAKLNQIVSGGVVPPVVPTGVGLTVALAADNPASGTIVDGQALAPLAKLTFTNGDNAEVKITGLKLKRIGVSADASIGSAYLFDGAVRLTDGAAVSSSVINFNDSAGLFTVPAGNSKTISVLADISAANAVAGETIGVQVVVSTDVVSNASSIKGTYPITGNLMTIASGTLAGVEFNATTTPSASSIDPQDDYTMWQNSVIVTTRAADMTRISFRKTGSVKNSDLQNFRLYVDGTQVGSAVANLDANGYVTFDLTSAPKRLEAGTRVVKLLGNIVGGSSLNFTFHVWNVADVTVVDSQYLANITSDLVSDASFTKRSSGEQTVNSGVITFTKMTDSPSGNIVDGASNALLAKFRVKAAGEKIKIETLKVSVVVSDANVGYLRNGMLLANGVQIGSTSNLYDNTKTSPYYTSFSLGSSLIVEPGNPVTLEVKADIYDNDGTDDINADDTIQVRIEGSSSENNAIGQTSAATIDAPSADVDGNSLTVKTGSLSLSKNTAYTNHTVVAPLTNYKVASFNLNANTTEAVNVTAINVTVDEVSSYASNLYVKYGTQTTSVKPTVTVGPDSWSINYTLTAGATIPIDVYMDVTSGMNSGTGTVTVDIDGTTASSATSSDSASVDGQDLTYSSGAFTTAFASTPQNQVVAGNQAVEIGRWKFTSSYEAYTIQEIKIDPDVASTATSNAEDVISSVTLKDGDTVLATESFNNIDTNGSTGGYYFTGLNVLVPASTSKTLTVVANLAVPSATNGSSGLRIVPALTYTKYMNPQGTVATSTTERDGNSTYVYRSVPTLTSVALLNSGTTKLANGGEQDLYSFKVTASPQGDVQVKQFKITLTWSDSDQGDTLRLHTLKLLKDGLDITSSVTIQDEDLGITAEDVGGVSEGNGLIIVTWDGDTEDSISAGKPTTYTIKGTPAGFGVNDTSAVANDAVALQFITDSADVTFGSTSVDYIGYLNVGSSLTSIMKLYTAAAANGSAENANLIWSDESAVAHSASTTASTTDWTNGYGILPPLNSQTWTFR